MKKKLISLVLAAALLLSGCTGIAGGQGKSSGSADAAKKTFGVPFDGSREFAFHGTLSDTDTALCYYSDSYFNGSSSEYNPSLATMSLCFELSCNPIGKTAEWTADATAKNPQFKNVRDLLIGDIDDESDSGLGFTDFDVNADWANKPGRNTIGVAAAHKTLADGSNLIAAAVRGAGYTVEWAGNTNVGNDGDHTGFCLARDGVLDFLDSYIKKYDITGNTKLWIVGYSRAGATANLAAAEIDKGHRFPNIGAIPKENLFAYCFAVPMGTTDEDANDEAYSNIHNIINYNDLVPMVAPRTWDFTRYNMKNDIIMPNITDLGEDFDEALDRMLDIYAGFENSEGSYIISEAAGVPVITGINWEKTSSGQSPAIKTEKCVTPTHDQLDRTMVSVADEIIHGRDIYYLVCEDLLCEVLAVLNGEGADAPMADDNTAQDAASAILGGLTFDVLWDIGSPMISPDDTPYSDKKAMCKDKLYDHLSGVLEAAELPDDINTEDDFASVLTETLWLMLGVAYDDLYDGNPERLSSAATAISGITEKSVLRAHYGEIALAWMMSMDKNYTGVEYEQPAGGHRTMRINGDVNVSVFDEDGDEVASVVDYEVTDDEILAYVNSRFEIVLVLPAGKSYAVEITAAKDGPCAASMEEISEGMGNTVRITAFDPVNLKKDDMLTCAVPAVSEGIGELGSAASYDLLTSGGAGIRATEALGDQLYTVTVERSDSNRNGLISGSGTYTYGSFALVLASAANGCEFEGWYQDGFLVSAEPIYMFRVTEDAALTAFFSGTADGAVSKAAE